MKPRPAFSYPDILVHPDGRCQSAITKEILVVTHSQGVTDGPSIYYRTPDGKTRYIAVKTLVAECFVIERKMGKGERVLSKDGNPRNTRYMNLEIDTGKRKRGAMDVDNDCHGWMNSDDIYC
jgi:hypothetical protein